MNEAERLVELIPRLRRYARALVGERAAADDLVQDTLERALAKLHLYRRGTDLRAWLFTVMHNVHVNKVRAARPTDSLDDEMPEEAERVAAWQRGSEELRALYEPILHEPVPVVLERAARGETRSLSAGRWRVTALVASAMVLGIALGGVAGWQLHASRPIPLPVVENAMAKRAAVAHAVYSPEVRHPVEVGADQEPHLVAWLSKRLGVKVKAPKLDEAGMSLVGGRLLPGDNGPVAQFMYQSQNGRRLTLYLRTAVLR